MKFICALLFCGIAYTTASPDCSKEVLEKCKTYKRLADDNPFSDPLADLAGYCKTLDCLIDYRDRCGNWGPGPYMPDLYKLYKSHYNALCTSQSPLREKYFDNVKCLETELKTISEKCKTDNEIDKADVDYCKKVKDSLDCTYQGIAIKCGGDAKDVLVEVYPGLEFYGCVEGNK